MESRRKYFIFNKESDYRRGYLWNMEVLENGIRVQQDIQGKGIFVSRILDSRQTEMHWHRLRFRGNEQQLAAIRLSIYAGNQRRFMFKGRDMDLEDFIRCGEVLWEEKLRCMNPWLQKQETGQDEMLLHEVRGRYLWFVVEMYPQQGMDGIHDIQVFFPGQSWIEYLPEIYQKEDKDTFLERYLGIFQTVYEDLDEEIRQASSRFDLEAAQGEDLIGLARWLGIENSYIWPEKKLRLLLGNGVSLYQRRGTRQGMIDFITLYMGEPPFLVENHRLQYFRKDRRRYERLLRLYGSEAYSFTVLVREEAAGTPGKQKALVQLIEEIKPVHMEWRLVILKPFLFADRYSYLGINSVLGKYRSLALDGHSVVSFTVLEGGNQL